MTVYPWHTGKLSRTAHLMVVSDLHDRDFRDILPMLTGADALLIPGDTADRHRRGFSEGIRFVEEASRRLPTFVGVGNHEMRMRDFGAFRDAVARTDAKLLFNEYLCFGELVIGCWYRPECFGYRDMLPDMEAEGGCRVLLCHRPEDYIRRLRGCNVDLVLAGHAHGGQVRVMDRGLFAPGQGIFPRYTRGVVDDRMIISAGASNTVPIPRWGNPCEVLRIDLD